MLSMPPSMPSSAPRVRRSAAVLAALVVAPLAVVGTTAGTTAPAAAADAWRVPAHASLTVKGHGYGHGHGMSQYGAEGAARQGLDYRQIAEFYYAGTSWGRAKGRVSVLITADTTDDLVVEARKGLVLRDRGSKQRWRLPDNGASRWRITPTRGGGGKVAFLKKRWRPFAEVQGDAQFFAHGDPVTLVTPSGTRAYRGRLRAVATGSGTARSTVNVVTLENYVKGVVPLEMPALWSPQAVRAQAVAARTYAAYERDHPLASGYQICDTSSCQVYGGADAEHPASNAAVADTRGEALLAGGRPAFTQFGSSSGGWTSAGSVPYLGARKDPYDGWAGNPVHAWTTPVNDATLERTWPGVGNLRRVEVTGRDGNGDWGGRVRTLALVGSKGRVVVSGDSFRSALGLRSTWFTFKVRRSSGRQAAQPVQQPRHDADLLAADLERR